MTRINVGVSPSALCRQHLIAEHREIKRIPNAVSSGKAKIVNIPKTFGLGTGHVKFFYDKLGFLLKRYKSIHKECLDRGYNVQDYSSAWDNIPENLMNDYLPTSEDQQLVLKRIQEKLGISQQ